MRSQDITPNKTLSTFEDQWANNHLFELLDSLPHQKQIQELNSRTKSKDYLAKMLKWSHIINQHLNYVTWEIQQYKELTAEFEEKKHLYYQTVHQHGYSNGHASELCWRQYKLKNVSQMFFPPFERLSPSPCIHRGILKIHAHIIDPQIAYTPQNLTPKRYWHQCEAKLVTGPDAAFAWCQIYCISEQT